MKFKPGMKVVSYEFGIGTVTHIDNDPSVSAFPIEVMFGDYHNESVTVHFTAEGRFRTWSGHEDIRPLSGDFWDEVEKAACLFVVFAGGVVYGWLQWGGT